MTAPITITTPAVVKTPEIQKTPTYSWEELVSFVKQRRPLLGALFEHATIDPAAFAPRDPNAPTHVAGNLNRSLALYFSSENAVRCEQLKGKPQLEAAQVLVSEYFGVLTRVEPKLARPNTTSAIGAPTSASTNPPQMVTQMVESLAQRRERERSVREQAAREAVMQNPVITEARSLFGGELGPIEFPSEAQGSPISHEAKH